SDGKTARQSSGGPFAAAAGSDHQPEAFAGAPGGADRLAVSRPALRLSVYPRSRSAGVANAAGRRLVYPQAHGEPLRRGAVRALGREPLLPILLRRTELLP